jgi:hypothetical protein
MRPLPPADLLDAWERGFHQPASWQALVLLGVAAPDQASDALAGMSIGQRDACLLSLRESHFGPRVTGIVTCQACGEQIEVDFDIRQVRASPPADGEIALSVSELGYRVDFRLPGTGDIPFSVHDGDVEATRRALFERCVVAAYHDGRAVSPASVPPQVVEAVEARMGEADPQADIRLALACSECAFEWEAAFDIATFLWTEVDVWARRTLFEVHLLASAYGWGESDILALSSPRRRFYLEAVTS